MQNNYLMMSAERSRSLAGLPISPATLEEAVTVLCALPRSRARCAGADVHLINAYSIALSEKDPGLRRCLERAACNLPDGRPLSWLTRFSGQPLAHVRGPSLFVLTLDGGRSSGVRHFFLGSTKETLALLTSEAERRYPGLTIAGTYSPPFRALTVEDLQTQDDTITAARPDIVWVGLGTPKQDFEAQRIAAQGHIAVAVGAAFDFLALTKPEAPPWMTRAGLEWVFRFASEPRRLWKRYLVGNAVFLWAVLRKRA